MEYIFQRRILNIFYIFSIISMLKELKQNWNIRKQNLAQTFQWRKNNLKKKYAERFPTPKMEKPTTHLLEKNQDEITLQSTKTTRLIVKFWLIGLATVILWYMMYISLSYIYMVIAAFIISLALEWCIIFWQRITKSRWIWILITYLLTTFFVLSGFIILIPFFFNRWTELLQSLMSWLLKLQSSLTQLWVPWYIEETNWIPTFLKDELIQWMQNSNSDSILNVITENIWSIMSTSSGYVKSIAWQAIIFFWNIFSIIIDLSIVITLCIFFSIAHYDIKYGLKYIFRHYTNVLPRIDLAYSWITTWLKSQLFLCLFIWIMSYLWLRVLELFGISIPQKWTLAILAWLFEIIPYIWPFLWCLPAAISAIIFSGWWGLLAVIILYLTIQQSEEKFLVPVLMWKTLWVSPLIVFLCMILCGTIMWFLWVLLAVPMAVIVSLAFHVPQADELEKSVKKIEKNSTFQRRKISKK